MPNIQVQGFTATDWERHENYNDGPRAPRVCRCENCRTEGLYEYQNGTVPDDCLHKRRPDAEDE